VRGLRVHGQVALFDEDRGDGVVSTDLGESLYFHCVSIADGSRVIALGAKVNAERSVGHLGCDEVIDLRLD